MFGNQMSRYGGISRALEGNLMGKIFILAPSDADFLPDLNATFTNDNQGEVRVFTTPVAAAAACVSGRGDIVLVAPGTYTLTAALVPLANTSFIAMRKTNAREPNVIFLSDSIADLIQIDVDDVYFEGIMFKAGDATCDNLIDYADGAASKGLSFVNCVFHGDDKTSVVGINDADATYAGTSLRVSGCLFRDLTGTHINVGVKGFAYSQIDHNQFAIDIAAGTAISLDDTSAFATGKGYTIEKNIFTGVDSTADEVGITVAGTENTTAAGIIRENMFSYLAAAAVTVDKISSSQVNNYYGDAATGGTLVDPGT